MKLLLVIVSMIAVFTADCHDLATKTEKHESTNNVKNYTDDPLDHDSSSEYPLLKEGTALAVDGPKGDDSTEVDQQLETPSLIQTGLQGPTLMEELANPKRELRRSGCKARNACVVMGGFCVTNATLCSGRLVAEGCKGINCQCCVPGTLELNIQNIEVELLSMKHSLNDTNEELKLELHCMSSNTTEANTYLKMELQSMQANMTTGNSNMDLKMESVKSSVSNQDSELRSIKSLISNQDSELSSIKSAISNQDSELNTIKSAISNQDSELNTIKSGISNQDSELDTIKSAISNQDSELSSIKSAISSQDSELNTIKSAISNQYSELNTIKSAISNQDSELNTMKTAIVNQELKLNSMKEVQDCFYVSSQCFRLYMDVKRNWTSARDRCQSAGLRLAEPTDSIAASLRKYVLDKFGDAQAWVGARGDGSKLVWEKRRTSISKDSTLLQGGRGGSMTTNYCLELDVLQSQYRCCSSSPYDVTGCTTSHWTLCEAVKGLVY